MHSDDDNSSDNATGPALPAGVLRSRGGWDDVYNIEREHQRERLRAAGTAESNAATGGKAASQAAAVDLAQFRNEEVGKGYQAKHVVRQKAAPVTAVGVVDMTGGKFSKKKRGSESSASTRKRSCNDDGGESNSHDDGKKRPSVPEDARLQSYLTCKGMRDFMKDIDNILNQ